MAERRVTGTARARVTAMATITVVVVLAAVGVGLVIVQRQVLTDNLEDSLRERAATLERAVRQSSVPNPIIGQGDDDAAAQVVDRRGLVVASTTNLRGEPAIAGPPAAGQRDAWRTVRDVPIDDVRYHVLSRRVGTFVVHVGSGMDDIDETAQVLITSLVIAIPVIALVLALLTWWLVGRMLVQVDEAMRRQRRFVADASHELRSPLTRIRSELEVDLAHPQEADLRETHRSVLEEAIALERLVDDLLQLARSDEGDQPVRQVPVDLDDVVLRQAGDLRGRGVAVDTAAVSPVQVHGDAAQLRRAIGNIVDNAARHGGGRISLAVTDDDGFGVVTVTDDGPGIPLDQRERVFERFARLDDARTPGGGAGLGLAIARDIVERHGGRVAIDQATPRGTTVTIRLPLGG